MGWLLHICSLIQRATPTKVRLAANRCRRGAFNEEPITRTETTMPIKRLPHAADAFDRAMDDLDVRRDGVADDAPGM